MPNEEVPLWVVWWERFKKVGAYGAIAMVLLYGFFIVSSMMSIMLEDAGVGALSQTPLPISLEGVALTMGVVVVAGILTTIEYFADKRTPGSENGGAS